MTKRYSGISFGGIVRRVTIFGDKYNVTFGQGKTEDKKTAYGYKVEETNKWNKLFGKIYLFLPLIDVAILVVFVLNWYLHPFLNEIIGTPSFVKSAFFINFIVYALPLLAIFAEIFLIYFLIMRGVRTWHGSEHKLIAAMENNDIDNAEKYSPIHERCGGTLMPTIIVANTIWAVIMFYTFIPVGNFTFVSLFIFLNVRYFHKYDKVGLWFGKWLQRHVTISEPEPWKINLGRIAAKQLMLAEEGKEYRDNALLIK